MESILESCRCCLRSGTLKEMWSEYQAGDKQEIYGHMLADCYSIALHQPLSHMEYICLSCIKMLRKAMAFKDMVLSSEQTILQHMSGAQEQENVVRKFEYEIEECVYDDNEMISQDDNDENYLPSPLESDDSNFFNDSDTQDDDKDVEYLEVEYLDEHEDSALGKDSIVIKTENVSGEGGSDTSKRKWPKKKKKSERLTSYRNYTNKDLIKCVKAVSRNNMRRAEASALYNVPIKTLSAKLRDEVFMRKLQDRETESTETNENREKHSTFLEEIKMVLTFTNATIYKSKSGRYFCPYCVNGQHRNHIDDPNKLRQHIETKHAGERIKSIPKILSPYWLNEVVKIDIENLKCVLCCIAIDSWNEVFEHLRIHGVELDQSYARLIPYKLTDDLKCALCGQEFLHYHILDSHMNAHYNNYICGECGDSFLAEHRLKKHAEIHSTSRFPCSYCKKVFSLDKYRKKHIDGVHNQKERFQCIHCVEKFRSDYLRHMHMVKEHMEKVKSITCDICFRTFDWRPYYLKHMRLQHSKKEKKYKCTKCDKEFRMRHQLKNHEEWHNGDDKYVCSICNKKFVSTQYLQKHISTHTEVIEAIVME